MTSTLRFICFANSIKHNPLRCFAGKNLSGPNDWIRPVSKDVSNEGAVSPQQSKLLDGTQPSILDIIELELDGAAHHPFQSENHLISNSQWKKVDKFSYTATLDLLDSPTRLWINGYSTYAGLNDKIPHDLINEVGSSLALIRPNEFFLKVTNDGGGQYPSKKGIRGHFEWHGVRYRLKITDPKFMEEINNYDVDREYNIEGAILCLSISDLHQSSNCHYKLIAGIITPDM